jgi:phosphoribosylaminoimidazolecarboxamide formyltransferase/IMP cyclohydrolase
LIEFAQGLRDLGVELVGSGGTAQSLRDAGLPVEDVETLTGSPEMLGGRVKTLHPRIHGGILARRDHTGDRADLEMHGLLVIDLVVVNLYPFEATVTQRDVTLAQAIEKIDIGGPSMIRSAAKNHAYVASSSIPTITPRARRAARARRTRRCDARATRAQGVRAHRALRHGHPRLPGVARGRGRRSVPAAPRDRARALGDAPLRREPHQRAALYGRFFDVVEPLHGKELSFNNIVDVQAALALIVEFAHADRTAVAILKHNTPCGVGLGATPVEAVPTCVRYRPESPFGGIIVASRPFDLALASAVDEIFTEVLIAPASTTTRSHCSRRRRTGACCASIPSACPPPSSTCGGVFGGVLVQEPDHALEDVSACRVATQRKPTEDELRALAFAGRS